MIGLDELERRAMACADSTTKICIVNSVSIVELITRLRQAEKDAARYRCIKSTAKVIECEEFDMDMLDGQDLDAMVDECIEAMQCK